MLCSISCRHCKVSQKVPYHNIVIVTSDLYEPICLKMMDREISGPKMERFLFAQISLLLCKLFDVVLYFIVGLKLQECVSEKVVSFLK